MRLQGGRPAAAARWYEAALGVLPDTAVDAAPVGSTCSWAWLARWSRLVDSTRAEPRSIDALALVPLDAHAQRVGLMSSCAQARAGPRPSRRRSDGVCTRRCRSFPIPRSLQACRAEGRARPGRSLRRRCQRACTPSPWRRSTPLRSWATGPSKPSPRPSSHSPRLNLDERRSWSSPRSTGPPSSSTQLTARGAGRSHRVGPVPRMGGDLPRALRRRRPAPGARRQPRAGSGQGQHILMRNRSSPRAQHPRQHPRGNRRRGDRP